MESTENQAPAELRSSRSVSIRAPVSFSWKWKARSTKPHETARRRFVLGDASCDFVDRLPPSKQENFKMTHHQPAPKSQISPLSR